MALFMLFLPKSNGRFPVGATTFKLPVSTKVLGTVKISRHGHNDGGPTVEPALQLDEVVFTAYYPADINGSNIKKGLDWLLRPLQASLHGYAHYSGISTWLLWLIVYLYGRLLRIPVYPNAPLLRQRPTAFPEHTQAGIETRPSSWPLVIFSHGLGGSRTAYSQVCTRLASAGRVVLAIQHRDGSGHAFISLTAAPRLYVREKDLIWTSDGEKTMIDFRQQQLAFRRYEIYLAFRSFKQLIQDGYQGSTHGLQSIDKKFIDWSSWSSDVEIKAVECDKDVLLAGHSFGGATVFTILSTDPPADISAPIPIHKALILDPWLEPIPSPGPCPPPQGPRDALPQLLVINSEKFSLWKDHFARLIGVVQAWEPKRRRVLTILRSQHESFSDFPLLPLVSRRAAHLVMDRIMELSEAFIDGEVDTFVDEIATRKMEIRIVGKKPDGSPQRQLVGQVGEVIAH